MGPYQVNASLGMEAGVFDGGTYFAISGFQGITVVSFVDGESIETFFPGSLSAGVLAPNILALGNLSGPIYVDLSTHELTDLSSVEVTPAPEQSTCAPMFTASMHLACFDQSTSNSYFSHRDDPTERLTGRLAGFSAIEGLSFAHVWSGNALDPHWLVALNEESPGWVEFASFDAGICGVWSEK